MKHKPLFTPEETKDWPVIPVPDSKKIQDLEEVIVDGEGQHFDRQLWLQNFNGIVRNLTCRAMKGQTKNDTTVVAQCENVFTVEPTKEFTGGSGDGWDFQHISDEAPPMRLHLIDCGTRGAEGQGLYAKGNKCHISGRFMAEPAEGKPYGGTEASRDHMVYVAGIGSLRLDIIGRDWCGWALKVNGAPTHHRSKVVIHASGCEGLAMLSDNENSDEGAISNFKVWANGSRLGNPVNFRAGGLMLQSTHDVTVKELNIYDTAVTEDQSSGLGAIFFDNRTADRWVTSNTRVEKVNLVNARFKYAVKYGSNEPDNRDVTIGPIYSIGEGQSQVQAPSLTKVPKVVFAP